MALMIALAGGVSIEVFFQLVKYRDESSSYPRGVDQYDELVATSYMPVSRFISSGKRQWVKYFIFRLFPPVLIMIMVLAVFQKYYTGLDPTIYLLICALTSLLVRDIKAIFTASYLSQKLIHGLVILCVLSISYIISLMSTLVSFEVLAPSVSGLIDSLWSSLIVAMLVLIYLEVTKFSGVNNTDEQENNYTTNYILTSYEDISEKYDEHIRDFSERNNTDIVLLYAVLIYENMNRPEWMRKIENIVCGLTHLEMTLGIAQVKTNKIISDVESIKKASKILANSSGFEGWSEEDFAEFIKVYNGGKDYPEEVRKIIRVLNEMIFLEEAE